MSTAGTKSRAKKQAKPAGHKPAPRASRWSRAFQDQKLIVLTGIAYILTIIAESVYAGVPVAQFFRVFYVVPLIVIKCIVLLVALALAAFVRGVFLPEAKRKRLLQRCRHGWGHMDELVTRYLDGDVFAYGCIGLIVMVANGFFFLQKCLLRVLNPYAWDPALAAADRFLHFGHSPDKFVVPLTQMLHLGRVLDIAYFIWFAVMYLSLSFTLFWDNDLRRRLRFLWCFLLCWILLGSAMATYFSSVGPAFFHNFYPHLPDPYADFVNYIKAHGPADFPIAFWSQDRVLEWTKGKDIVTFNVLSAFPSMHMAIAWLATLYGFSIDRRAGWAGAGFCVLIYLGTVLFGYHYALDLYASIALVSLMWWGAGKLLDRRHGDAPPLKRS